MITTVKMQEIKPVKYKPVFTIISVRRRSESENTKLKANALNGLYVNSVKKQFSTYYAALAYGILINVGDTISKMDESITHNTLLKRKHKVNDSFKEQAISWRSSRVRFMTILTGKSGMFSNSSK